MSILDNFHLKQDVFMTLDLKDEGDKRLIELLPPQFRICYITDEELTKNTNPQDIQKAIEACIPDPGRVMAGEFGELLSYHILQEHYLPLKLNGIKKWIWKEGRNFITRNSDVILLHRSNDKKESKDDLAVFGESKVKATNAHKLYNPISAAIEGSELDSVQRYVSTLIWLKERYRRSSDTKGIEMIDRFLKPIDSPYKKHFKAVAVVEKDLIEEMLKQQYVLPDIKDDLQVIVITVKGLKLLYEEVYRNIPLTYTNTTI